MTKKNRGRATGLANSKTNQPDTTPANPSEQADALEAIAKDIERLQGTAIFEVAKRLAEARDLFRYRRDEGGFSGWVETRLNISLRTAYNLLHVHERFGGDECVQHLHTFPTSVVYQLAGPNASPEVIDQIIARVEAGEKPRDVVADVLPARPKAQAVRVAITESDHKPTTTMIGMKVSEETESIEVPYTRGPTRTLTIDNGRVTETVEPASDDDKPNDVETSASARKTAAELEEQQVRNVEQHADFMPPDAPPPTKTAAPDKLDPKAWKTATADERTAFLKAIGPTSFFEVMPEGWEGAVREWLKHVPRRPDHEGRGNFGDALATAMAVTKH